MCRTAPGDVARRVVRHHSALACAKTTQQRKPDPNNVLFPMADQVLPAEEQIQLAGLFDKVEEEEIGPGVHERYHQLAHELAGA
jgi:hemerythrin-like domain-containing protein